AADSQRCRLARRRASSHFSFWGSSASPNSIIRAGGEGRVCARQTRNPRRPPRICATYATARMDASELSTTTSSLVISNSGLLAYRFVRGETSIRWMPKCLPPSILARRTAMLPRYWRPIRRPGVIVVKPMLVLASDGNRLNPLRAILDGFLVEVDEDFGIQPTHPADP